MRVAISIAWAVEIGEIHALPSTEIHCLLEH